MLTITARDGGYRLEDRFGNWTDYDSEARMIVSGICQGKSERPLYDNEDWVTGYAELHLGRDQYPEV